MSKIFHTGIPGDIENDSNGSDDPLAWSEFFNSPGPEWKSPGDGETLENNPEGLKPVVGGNTFVVARFQIMMVEKLKAVRDNDLPPPPLPLKKH